MAVQHRRSFEPEDAAKTFEDNRDRSDARETRHGFGLGAGTRPLGGAPGSERDETAHGARHREKDEKRNQVLRLSDGECVEGRREVPVDEEEGGNGRGDGRPEPTECRDCHDEQKKDQEHGRKLELISELCEHRREDGQPNQRQQNTKPLTTAR